MSEAAITMWQTLLQISGTIAVGVLSYLGVARTASAAHDRMLIELKAEQEKQQIRSDEQIKTIKAEINKLEEKQDKHNAVIERTFKLEQRVDDLEKHLESK